MSANFSASGNGDDIIIFDRAVGYLNIYVASSVEFSISVDKGQNFLSLPSGFHSFPIGPVFEVSIRANGEWGLLAIQA